MGYYRVEHQTGFRMLGYRVWGLASKAFGALGCWSLELRTEACKFTRFSHGGCFCWGEGTGLRV